MHHKPYCGRTLSGPAGRAYNVPTNPLAGLKVLGRRKGKECMERKGKENRRKEEKENVMKNRVIKIEKRSLEKKLRSEKKRGK